MTLAARGLYFPGPATLDTLARLLLLSVYVLPHVAHHRGLPPPPPLLMNKHNAVMRHAGASPGGAHVR